MPSENCVRCNIPLVRAVEKTLCCNCEDHGLSAEDWKHLQFASRECECQLCEKLASRFRVVAGPNDEPDFCVCDYRPRRKCSVHPESSNASQVEAIFQGVEEKLLSGELSETWPEIREWISRKLKVAALTPVPVVAATTCPHCNHAPHKPGLCDFGLADGECPCDDSASPVSREPLADISICPRCEGSEIYNEKTCSICEGTGRIGPDGQVFKRAGVSREPISAEQFMFDRFPGLQAKIDRNTKNAPEFSFTEMKVALEAYARAAARTCETTPDYRDTECSNCKRHRVQWNGICEKCEWDNDCGDYASITGRCAHSPHGGHIWIDGNNIIGPPFKECKHCHIQQGEQRPARTCETKEKL